MRRRAACILGAAFQMSFKKWINLALLLAVAFLLQSIRLIIPMVPGPLNMFLIGSLLNMVMVLAIWHEHTPWAALIGVLLPIGAYMEGQLPILPMVPVVAIGNAAFTLAAGYLGMRRRAYIAPLIKAGLLLAGTQLVLTMLALPAPMSHALTFMMSWPQIVTGSIGIWLAGKIMRRI